ncbi:GNAT family N-acetyltransferase [Salipaludibacillus daqingensis]|uniref:GNAT family N-acetyltransferase n=1 Tax=Salipaludibacillus daqingensis TaxID=3041001 RepID=UPI0024738816|nr:GNAT family N-acetyltransferase [Salipaludibacillus daqingensis]
MTIRKLYRSEIESSIRMSEFAFQYEMTDEERNERIKSMDPNETWVIEENSDILSKATVLPLHVYLDGKSIPMGGVSGVVTWPEKRRGGLVSQLLHHSLKQMKQDGQVISFLYPFSIPFYRKYGWELFADAETITLTREQLPPREDHKGKVKRVDKDFTIIDDVYHQWAKKYTGTIVRNEKWWNQSVFKRKKGMLVAYYNHEQNVTGYMIYEVKNQKMTVHELIWLDVDARRGLWSFISNHDSMIETATIKTVAHDRLPFLLPDPKVKREVSSYFMARIVDVEGFLNIYPFHLREDSPPIILHIYDAFCPWNDGIYMINNKNGANNITFFPPNQQADDNQIGVNCQHPPKKGLRLSVQALASLLLQSQTLNVLVEEEWVKGDAHTMTALNDSLPKLKPFLYDFF